MRVCGGVSGWVWFIMCLSCYFTVQSGYVDSDVERKKSKGLRLNIEIYSLLILFCLINFLCKYFSVSICVFVY